MTLLVEGPRQAGDTEAEILPPKYLDRMARLLFETMERLDPTEDGDNGWGGLTEHRRDFYRVCVGSILENKWQES